jgi:hypothetical protein
MNDASMTGSGRDKTLIFGFALRLCKISPLSPPGGERESDVRTVKLEPERDQYLIL